MGDFVVFVVVGVVFIVVGFVDVLVVAVVVAVVIAFNTAASSLSPPALSLLSISSSLPPLFTPTAVASTVIVLVFLRNRCDGRRCGLGYCLPRRRRDHRGRGRCRHDSGPSCRRRVFVVLLLVNDVIIVVVSSASSLFSSSSSRWVFSWSPLL